MAIRINKETGVIEEEKSALWGLTTIWESTGTRVDPETGVIQEEKSVLGGLTTVWADKEKESDDSSSSDYDSSDSYSYVPSSSTSSSSSSSSDFSGLWAVLIIVAILIGIGSLGDIMKMFNSPTRSESYSPPARRVYSAPINVAPKPMALPATTTAEDTIFSVGQQGVQPPVVLIKPDPSFTEEAKVARVEGTLQLQAIVRKNGTVDIVKVIKSLGFGLDEAAINIISTKWRFKPGTLNGEPVNVRAIIEVSFHQY